MHSTIINSDPYTHDSSPSTPALQNHKNEIRTTHARGTATILQSTILLRCCLVLVRSRCRLRMIDSCRNVFDGLVLVVLECRSTWAAVMLVWVRINDCTVHIVLFSFSVLTLLLVHVVFAFCNEKLDDYIH